MKKKCKHEWRYIKSDGSLKIFPVISLFYCVKCTLIREVKQTGIQKYKI